MIWTVVMTLGPGWSLPGRYLFALALHHSLPGVE